MVCNILLLCLDARIGNPTPRCDAIHMISFSPNESKLIITSVPRGTKVAMPGVEENSNYLSNMCSIQGIPAAVAQIEKITGLEHNYLVKIGFSQAIGLFRLGNLPAEPTLEFLRNRQSYGLGDYQRSYNQAVFIKDMILRQTGLAANLPEPLERLAYQTVDTDLPFDQAKLLFRQFLESKIYLHPENISIVIKPADNLTRQDIHLADQLASATDWQTDPSFQNYQQQIINRLQATINQPSSQTLATIIQQQPWLQIENITTRNSLHFQILQVFAKSAPDKEKAKNEVQNFISEMQLSNQSEFILKGQSLLSQILSSPN